MIRRSIVLLICAVCSTGAKAQTPMPKAGSPKDFNLPAKEVSELDNGLTATLVQYGSLPKVNVSLIIKTGNIHENEHEMWLGDLVASMLKEGSTSTDARAISRKVAAMGGQLNINTGYNQMTVYGSVLSEFAPDLIAMMADILINPAFPASELDRLKNDLKRNLALQKNQPQSQATEMFRSIIYKDHSYARYFPSDSLIDTYTLDMVKQFYDKNVGARRSAIYVVGFFDEDIVMQAIEDSFDNWREGAEVDYQAPVPTATSGGQVAIIDRSESPQTTIMMGLRTIGPAHADYLALSVTNSLLGGSFGSRITSNLREDKGYTYSPFSTINNGFKSSFWYEVADVTTEHTGASLLEISKEIRKLQQEPPTEEELNGIKKYEAGMFVLQNSSRFGIINQLNLLDFHGLSEEHLTKRVKNIYELTPADIQRMANQYLRYEDMTIVLVGDKDRIAEQIEKHDLNLQIK